MHLFQNLIGSTKIRRLPHIIKTQEKAGVPVVPYFANKLRKKEKENTRITYI